MPRSTAACCISFANFGKCSLIWMPGTDVSIGRNSPRMLSGASGLRSNVSRWLGPPAIHSRMHDLACGCSAACAASRPSQPLSVPPAAASERNSRREMIAFAWIERLLRCSVVQRKLAGHQQRPGQFPVGGLRRCPRSRSCSRASCCSSAVGRRDRIVRNRSSTTSSAERPPAGDPRDQRGDVPAGELRRVHLPQQVRNAALVARRVGVAVVARRTGRTRAARPAARRSPASSPAGRESSPASRTTARPRAP